MTLYIINETPAFHENHFGNDVSQEIDPYLSQGLQPSGSNRHDLPMRVELLIPGFEIYLVLEAGLLMKCLYFI